MGFIERQVQNSNTEFQNVECALILKFEEIRVGMEHAHLLGISDLSELLLRPFYSNFQPTGFFD